MTQQIPCGELTPGRELIEVFEIENEHVSGFSIIIATYTKTLRCTVRASLFRISRDEFNPSSCLDLSGAEEIASETGSWWSDNSTLTLFAAPGSLTVGGLYALKIASPNGVLGAAATAWLHSGEMKLKGHRKTFFCGIDQGSYGLMATVCESSPVADSDVPQAILYSPITQCNLNCIHCISKDTRNKKYALCESIKKNIKSLCDEGKIKLLSTDYSGDILWADEKFGGELDFIFSLNIPFHVDTNGAYLSRRASERLVSSKLVSLNVSLDAATDENFRRIRKGAPPLREVLGNIAEFSAARARAGVAKHKQLSLSFTLMKSTIHEWKDFIRMAAGVGADCVITRHLEAYSPDMAAETLIFDPDMYNQAYAEAVVLAAELGIAMGASELPPVEAQKGHSACAVPWGSAVILGNGDVAVCCVPKTTIGNLHEESFEALWNSERYQQFRKRVNTPDPPPQCNACPMMRRQTNLHSYLPYLTMADWTPPREWPLTAHEKSCA